MKAKKHCITAATILLSLTVCASCSDSISAMDDGYSGNIESIAADTNRVPIKDNPNPIYDNVQIRELEVSGEPQSYEELQDYLAPYSDGMNFVKYEIIKQYTPEEAYGLTDNDIFLYASTLYDARVIYDYMNDTPLSLDITLALAGTAEEQIENAPLYMAGDVYASFIPNLSTETWNVGFPELTFAVITDNTDYAYHLRFDNIEFVDAEGKNIDKGINEAETLVITSTANNPVKYVKKIDMDSLSDYLYEDWITRGYTISESLIRGE